jgi:hypothetical protein
MTPSRASSSPPACSDDELVQTIGTSDYVLVDQRRASGFNLVNEAAYRALQRARASAEQVIAAYRQFDATAVGSNV